MGTPCCEAIRGYAPHSRLVRSSSPTLRRGLSTDSIPGPIGCDCFLESGNTYTKAMVSHSVLLIAAQEMPGNATNSCAAPPQPERSLVCKQLAKPKHHAIDKREEEVDRGAAEKRPECGRLIQDDGWGRGRGR